MWALGCVLYFCIVGESPFERVCNDSGGNLMLAVLNGDVQWPTTYPTGYGYTATNKEKYEKLQAVVRQCLTLDAAKRPFVHEIERMLRNV